MTDVTQTDGPAGYRLGDSIALQDLLALPPDDRDYDRDAAGRLILMSPDDAETHRLPVALLDDWLGSRLRPPSWFILQTPGIAFEPTLSLAGERLPPSRLGRKTVGPDLAIYEGRPRFRSGQPDAPDHRYKVFAPERLRVAVEFLSRRTKQSDLGLGAADQVDRWRTYRENGVSEYWLLNAAPQPCGLPPRAGLFLRNAGERWEPLACEGSRPSGGRAVHGLQPLASGTIHSAALGLRFDLGAFWRAVAGEPAD